MTGRTGTERCRRIAGVLGPWSQQIISGSAQPWRKNAAATQQAIRHDQFSLAHHVGPRMVSVMEPGHGSDLLCVNIIFSAITTRVSMIQAQIVQTVIASVSSALLYRSAPTASAAVRRESEKNTPSCQCQCSSKAQNVHHSVTLV
jgi:hypothetical protein